MWVLCLRWKEGGGVLNCLHCSALALLLHSAIMWPIQEPRTERKKKKKKRGLCGIFLNQKRWHPSAILGAKSGSAGRRRGGGGGGRRWWWWGGGSQCGTPEKKLASGLCEPPGAPFSITIGSGAMPTSELPSHIEKRERSIVRGGAREKKRCEKQMCGGGGGERVALNPTHF